MPGKPAASRETAWWVQAEALPGALTMYEMTGEARFLEVFDRAWRLVIEKLVDGRTGEWHARIAPDGTLGGDKAQNWKAGYQ